VFVALVVLTERSEETRPLTRMTRIAVAEPLHFHEHSVIVAIDEDVDDFEAIAGSFALHPQLVARPAEKGGEAAPPRLGKRVLVHEADHEDLGAVRILNHSRNEKSIK
jgi:hypothetical protein